MDRNHGKLVFLLTIGALLWAACDGDSGKVAAPGDDADASGADLAGDGQQSGVDLTVDVGANKLSAPPGAQFTFTATVSNHKSSASAATGIVLTADYDDELGVLQATPSAGTWDAATKTWSIESLQPGTDADLVFIAVPGSLGDHELALAVTALDQEDQNPDDDAASATVEVITEAASKTDLAVAIETDKSEVDVVPSPVEIKLTVSNVGPTRNTGIVVKLNLPQTGLELGTAPDKGSYDAPKGTWTFDALDSGQSEEVTMTYQVTKAGSWTITAHITGDLPDTNGANNLANVQLTAPEADTGVTIAIDEDDFIALPGVFHLTLGVANAGPAVAHDVKVALDLPQDGLVHVDAQLDTGSYDPATGIWDVGDLDTESTPGAVIEMNVVDNGEWTVHASVTSDQPEASIIDNAAQISLKAQEQADISVTLSDSMAEVIVEETTTYEFTFQASVSNAGPAVATQIAAVFDLPQEGIKYGSFEADTGDYDPANGHWSFSEIPVGGTVNATVVYKVPEPPGEWTVGLIAFSAQIDPKPDDNETSVDIATPDAPQ